MTTKMVSAILNGMKLTIDPAGRIVVPKPMRERLGFRAGAELEIIEGPDGVLIRRTERKPVLVREGHLLVHTGKLPSGHDVADAVEDDREARAREIWSL